MKNVILGTLSAFMITNTTLAFTGNDKGNGGDGVMIGNELVMRDFVSRANFTQVEDTITFLDSIPGFREYIFELARTNGKFAEQVLQNLLKTTIYLSDTDLELLSANQTAVGGLKAQVQLAIRWGNEILISPKFFSEEFKDQRTYLMIHESLHGILDGEGAIHHTRVRTIVNYLKTNRGNYNKQSLREMLDKNGVNTYIKFEQYDGFIFDANPPPNMRCFVLMKDSGLNRYTVELQRYLGLSCSSDFVEFRKKFDDALKAEMDLSYLGDKEVYEILRDVAALKVRTNYYEIKLVKTGIFEKDLKYRQQDTCSDNRYEYKKLVELQKEAELYTRFFQSLDKYFSRTDVSAKEKLVVLDHVETSMFRGTYRASEVRANFEKYKIDLADSFKILKKNESKCVAMYGKNLGYK